MFLNAQWHKIQLGGGVFLVTPIAGKKDVPECHSGLCPDKELLESSSGPFCHKNNPGCNIQNYNFTFYFLWM
jgi:hypothetical protein